MIYGRNGTGKEGSKDWHRSESAFHGRSLKIAALMVLFVISGIVVYLWHSPLDRGRAAKNQVVKILDAVLENSTDVNLISESGVRITNLAGGELSAAIMGEITYEISSLEAISDMVELELLFIYPDIVALVEKFAEEGWDEQEFSEWLISSLKETYPTKEKILKLQMIENDDVFYLIVTNDLYDVLSGGVVSHTIQKEKEVYASWLELE